MAAKKKTAAKKVTARKKASPKAAAILVGLDAAAGSVTKGSAERKSSLLIPDVAASTGSMRDLIDKALDHPNDSCVLSHYGDEDTGSVVTEVIKGDLFMVVISNPKGLTLRTTKKGKLVSDVFVAWDELGAVPAP